MRRASAGGEGLSVRTFALEAPPQVGVHGMIVFCYGLWVLPVQSGGRGGGLIAKGFELKKIKGSLLHSMIITSNSKASVQ